MAWLQAQFTSSEENPYRWWWAAAVGVYYAWFFARVPQWIRAQRARQKALAKIAERLRAMY